MSKTYDAILEGDRLIWTGDRPAEDQRRLHVRVSVDEPGTGSDSPEGIIHRPTPEQVETGLRGDRALASPRRHQVHPRPIGLATRNPEGPTAAGARGRS